MSLTVDLARLILGRRQSKHRPDSFGVFEAGGHVNCSAIGQRYHRANSGDRHQAPAHIIVPYDGQQTAVQNPDLFAKHPPNNKEGLNQNGKIGEILDQLPDPRLELHRPDRAYLEAEVALGAAQVIFDGDGLGLQQLSMSQQHSMFLAAYSLRQ
jgi:hypothetical protein